MNEPTEKKVWVWRHWQTKGLMEKIACTWPNGTWRWNGYSAAQAWSYTREQAAVMAGERRDAKIASLKKQIAKLEKLKFD